MTTAFVTLMRLYYSLPLAAGVVVIVSYLLGGELAGLYDEMGWAFLSLSCIISAGYVFNDVCDIEVDRINCPRRTLPAGRLAKQTAAIGAGILLVLGLVAGGLCGPMFLLGVGGIAAMLAIYDLWSKRMGLLKDVLVAVLMTSLYPLAFTIAEPVATPRLTVLYLHPIWLFLSSLGYEMLKDIRDVEGDSRVSHCPDSLCRDRRFAIAAQSAIVAGSFLTVLPALLGCCGLIYLAASIGAVVLAVTSLRYKPALAIRFIYVEIALVTAGSMADLLVFGP